jgi:hypothetical protein
LTAAIQYMRIDHCCTHIREDVFSAGIGFFSHLFIDYYNVLLKTKKPISVKEMGFSFNAIFTLPLKRGN